MSFGERSKYPANSTSLYPTCATLAMVPSKSLFIASRTVYSCKPTAFSLCSAGKAQPNSAAATPAAAVPINSRRFIAFSPRWNHQILLLNRFTTAQDNRGEYTPSPSQLAHKLSAKIAPALESKPACRQTNVQLDGEILCE